MHRQPVLLPFPSSLEFTSGEFRFPVQIDIFTSSAEHDAVFPRIIELEGCISRTSRSECHIRFETRPKPSDGIRFEHRASLKSQGYEIEITQKSIVVSYADPPGSFYAVCTIRQLLDNYPGAIPCMKITDRPDFPVRGVLLDVSRDKIPTMKTMFRFVDFLASIKMNQLQLYMEGFSFAYPSFRDYWRDMDPLTGDEIVRLDRYCRERFIELVPCVNCFGHMQDWLSKPELRHLAECPSGYACSPGDDFPPATLDPEDPGSLRLVQKIISDMLPYFTSGRINVGCDETVELGMGKSRALCDTRGKGAVYHDYLMKISNLVKGMGKNMMFWGDIIIHYPETIPRLPADATVLEWGYDWDHPFQKNSVLFQKSGVPYYVCPGTSSWRSLTGRSENMQKNLRNAAEHGLENGATGYLITDWGDDGHWQYLPASYAGFSYGAALAWNYQRNRDLDVADFLNLTVFRDRAGRMGRFVLDCGNYYLNEKEHIENETLVFKILARDAAKTVREHHITEDELRRTADNLGSLLSELDCTDMKCEDARLIKAEYQTSLMMVRHGIQLGLYEIQKSDRRFFEGGETMLHGLSDEIDRIIVRHIAVWIKRNRIGGLQKSLRHLYALKEYYDAEQKLYREKAKESPERAGQTGSLF